MTERTILLGKPAETFERKLFLIRIAIDLRKIVVCANITRTYCYTYIRAELSESS